MSTKKLSLGIFRKILAICSGIVTFIVGILFIMWIQNSRWIHYMSNPLDENFVPYELSNYYLNYTLGLNLAFSLSIIFIIWEISSSYKRRLLIYIPFQIVIMAFSAYNFALGDTFVKPDIQFYIDLVLLFLSLIVVVEIWKMKIVTLDLRILSFMIFALILACGVFISLYFILSYGVDKLGIGKWSQFPGLNSLTTILPIITTIVTVLKYFDDRKKLKVSGS